MSTADSFTALGRGNGFTHCVTEKTLNTTVNEGEKVGDSGGTLGEAMSAYWNVKSIKYGGSLAEINLGTGFTFNRSGSGIDSVSYLEVPPIKRACPISDYIENNFSPPLPAARNWPSSFDFYEPGGDIDVEQYLVNFKLTSFGLNEDTGEKKYFHGLEFLNASDKFNTTALGGYRSSIVTFGSGPLLTASALAFANQNESGNLYGGELEIEENIIGTFSTFKEATQEIVTINGINFVKTVKFHNFAATEGSSAGSTPLDTHKLPLGSGSPSLDFYTYN